MRICGNESRIIAKHLQVVVGYTISKGVREGWRVKFDHSGSRVWKVQHSFARHIPLLYISKKESALHPKVQFVRPYPNFPGAVKRNCPVIPLILISMYDFTCQAWDTNLRESFGIVLPHSRKEKFEDTREVIRPRNYVIFLYPDVPVWD